MALGCVLAPVPGRSAWIPRVTLRDSDRRSPTFRAAESVRMFEVPPMIAPLLTLLLATAAVQDTYTL